MDQQKKSRSIAPHSFVPAQLWIGRHEDLIKEVTRYLQNCFCSNDVACHVCFTCRSIKEKKYQTVEWIYPEKTYTLEHVSHIRNRMSFQLAEHEQYFFILQKADFLTVVCANSLLKSLEEPTTGYHFILLAERKDALLPTIQSRCIIHTIACSDTNAFEPPLFAFFSTANQSTPDVFLKELENSQINERESIELVNMLLKHWYQKLKMAFKSDNTNEIKLSMQVIQVFTQALKKPPMPGSSKLFWKDLFLRIHKI